PAPAPQSKPKQKPPAAGAAPAFYNNQPPAQASAASYAEPSAGPAFVPQPPSAPITQPAQAAAAPIAQQPQALPPGQTAQSPGFQAPGPQNEEFPDMTAYRRSESQASPPTPTPVVPVSLPLTAGIPDPLSYVPPELAPAAPEAPAAPAFTAATAAPTRSAEAARTPEPAKQSEAPKRRSASKLLADLPDDEFEAEDSKAGTLKGSGRQGSAPAYQEAAPSSPMPKMMGAVAIFLALLKLPALFMYALPQVAQFPLMALDQVATIVALMALGLAMLMSKS
ncbi:MAG: hypothetical protein K2X27_19435, partial [Candidatus Obscuribacterales bacterium]|nr:hypothetical protein [Candidatus Obscuribacterales bacterium]